jgi:lysophospholipase L1-like esterase
MMGFVIPVFMILGTLTACSVSTTAGGGGGTTAPPAGLSSDSTSAAASASTTAPSPASAGVSVSPSGTSLHLVGLGDSYMTTQNAQGKSFLSLFAEQLQSARGRPVEVVSLARNDGTSANVRDNLANNSEFRDAVAKADVIVISVGGNDSDPFGIYPSGTCTPKSSPKSCLKAYAPHLAENYDAILSAVVDLRAGKPTAVRMMSADNPFVGWSESPTPTFGTDFYRQVAEAETAAACAAAKKHGALCVDFLHVFGGKNGAADTGKYLGSDHSHPGDLGVQTIAELLAKAGTPELD